jgi:hypothetical protein
MAFLPVILAMGSKLNSKKRRNGRDGTATKDEKQRATGEGRTLLHRLFKEARERERSLGGGFVCKAPGYLLCLEHVRDVKERGLGARVDVRGDEAEVAVHERHVPAAEGHHLGVLGDVQAVQRGLARRLQREE